MDGKWSTSCIKAHMRDLLSGTMSNLTSLPSTGHISMTGANKMMASQKIPQFFVSLLFKLEYVCIVLRMYIYKCLFFSIIIIRQLKGIVLVKRTTQSYSLTR